MNSSRVETVLAELSRVVRERYNFAKNLKEQHGNHVAGYFCTYAPEELFDAAGWLPVRLLVSESRASVADAHLQNFACSLARACLGARLSGELDFLDGVIFPHTCDTMQALAEIWPGSGAEMAQFTFMVPANVNSPHSREYLLAELRRVRRQVEDLIGHPIPDERLRESVGVFNGNRAALRRLYEVRRNRASALPGTAVQTVVEAGFLMPKRDHTALVNQLAHALEESAPDTSAEDKPRVVVAGGACCPSLVTELMEQMGAIVVDDDQCTGWRYISSDAPADGEPLEAIALRLLDRVPCPSKHREDFSRDDYLLDKVKTSGARGVVFHLLKYCDPWAFEYPKLRERLQEEGIPTLLLETEFGEASDGQLRTRLQAFIEMIG